jgi:hypothetical protein
MRRICLAAMAVILAASPALAQSSRKAQGPLPAYRASPDAVYSGDRRIGTDPDPNIRFELMREQNWRKGG